MNREPLLVDHLQKRLDWLPIILRESDKKMGWSLNSSDWYREEYKHQLASTSCKRVGGIYMVESLKVGCRKELKKLVSQNRDVLKASEYNCFNLEGKSKYSLPSLNLMPKVHK